MQVRHAQGVHNVEGETDHSAYMKPDFFDARVTPLGWNQVSSFLLLLCSALPPLHSQTALLRLNHK
jgi:hypothetical protein